MGITEKLRELIPNGYGYNSEFAHTMEEAATEIELLRSLLGEARQDIVTKACNHDTGMAQVDLLERMDAANPPATEVN